LTTPPPLDEIESGESGGNTSQKGDAKTKKPQIQVARKKINGKRPQPVQKTAVPEESDVEISEPNVDDHEENSAPTKRRRAKSKPNEIEDEDVTNEASVPPRKRKAVEEDVEIIDKPKATKKGSRAPSEVRETGKAKAKPRSRAGSKQPITREDEVDEGGEEDQTGPKKKKRKIFPSQVAQGPFAFDSLGQVSFVLLFGDLFSDTLLYSLMIEGWEYLLSFRPLGKMSPFLSGRHLRAW
jgi:hypothetical protein